MNILSQETYRRGELYDEDGEKITQGRSEQRDVLNIWGNGVIAESYPAQYNGITKMERTEQSNQEYIDRYGHYLEELFVEKDPSELPYLNVCYTDELADATVMIPDPLSYTWTYADESGGEQDCHYRCGSRPSDRAGGSKENFRAHDHGTVL